MGQARDCASLVSCGGYQVPEKYLQVLEELQEKIKQPVLKKFIEQNREIIASTAAEQALAADGAIACFGSSLIPSSGPGIARRR
jgi:hypothetical protein